MNFADIENAWRSPHNRPDAAALEKQKMQFLTELRRNRRATRGLLFLSAVPLVFFTTKIALHLVAPNPALVRVDLTREWAILPFFALPWIGWFALLREYVAGGRGHIGEDTSIQTSVAALLAEIRSQRRAHLIVGVLLVLSAIVLPLIAHQLRAVGKVGDGILLPAYILYPAYVLGMIAWVVWQDRRKLRPRESELRAVLESYR